jgi:hypothetical protein
MSARVAVEFPIEEARALREAARVTLFEMLAMGAIYRPGGRLDRARKKLEQGIAVEEGPCGSAEQPSLAERAEALIGRKVRVLTTTGAYKRGTLARVSSYHTLVLADHMGDNPISLTLVKAIEPEREGAQHPDYHLPGEAA